ncbi:MAG: hypothetical protein KF859_08870 [Phycisphaeraceae bacterium]|nr:hypothetical protein [Phycisphaeraceae bacterium]
MGLGISYVIRLSARKDVDALLAGAVTEAKRLGWKVARRTKGFARVEFTPHAKSEQVVLDFSDGLKWECYVKTNYAPAKTHMQIVAWLDVIKSLCKSLRVSDELGYWKNRDAADLKKQLDDFPGNANNRRTKPTVFTLGAATILNDGTVKKMKGIRIVVK